MAAELMYLKVDEMNLYDYVIRTFETMCDLSEGRLLSLNYYLNNVNARFVNVALFKEVFGVASFDDIMRCLVDEDNFLVLHQFGMQCEEDAIKEQNSIVPSNMALKKVPQK